MPMTHSLYPILLFLFLLGIFSCSDYDSPKSEPLPVVSVRVAKVESDQIPALEEVVGTLRPRLNSNVSAKATGRILRFLATPGMRVEKGALLVELEVDELKASLERALASLDQANRDLKRYQNLLKAGAATQSEFDRVQAQQRIAAATVKESQSRVANAAVTAPFAGVITRKFAETGDLADPGRPLFAIEDATLLRLEIDVAESLAGSLALGQKIKVAVGGASAILEGVVSEIAPAAEASSRTFLIKLDLPAHENLRAGQFGRAFLPRGVRAALIAPTSSVFSRGQMDYVFVSGGDGTAILRIVRTGTRSEDSIELLAGVEGNESVVLAPPASLRDGQPIKISN